MTDPDSSYRPRSPDFSSFQPFASPLNNTYQPQPPYLASPLDQRASYDASPFFNSGYQPPVQASRVPQQYVQQTLPHDYSFDMARRSARLSASAPQPPGVAPQAIMFDQHVPAPPAAPAEEPRQAKPWDGIEVKTKFPVARIKRIMQADEEVGKVAQVTPIAVSKALELFMISLVTKAAQEARDRNSKRVTAAHLKQAVSKDEVLDFLADICSKVPDHSSKKNDEDGSDHNEGKRKSGGRRKKDLDSDDF
ncbi:histone-fold-containing protein [Talaromyces proteolyticus]|uniref:NCT transcriptional regulatory complex subunit A n=1 Tax=Talaromyces proteolyticus TaxID=1131652 RepID=A0AAD4KED6_9EURO|nr:histone-fold-containing protein [Talaromyces proteolyticus]KAH8690257.1 histone-fold-containing protein [Talaromyces proteolyticus]